MVLQRVEEMTLAALSMPIDVFVKVNEAQCAPVLNPSVDESVTFRVLSFTFAWHIFT